MTRHRCGAPVQTRDPKRKWDTCRKFVAVEGRRCHLHQNAPALPEYDRIMRGFFQ